MTEVFGREDVIEVLRSQLGIPRSPFTYVHFQGVGPYDPNFFEAEQATRREQEARAVSQLHAVSDEELSRLCDSSNGLNHFAMIFELFDAPPWYAGGFGVEGYSPDYDHWAKMDFWSLEEAVCLSLGFKPEAVPSYHFVKDSPYHSLNFFIERMALVKRAPFYQQTRNGEFAPRSFLTWARSKDLDLPAALINAVGVNDAPRRPAMLNSVDKRKYDTVLKVVLGLLAKRYGEDLNSVNRDMKQEVTSGLERLGLALDPKTIANVLSEAVLAGERFVNEQHKKDEKGN